MKLPNNRLNRQKGQILPLALIVLVVAIVTSIVLVSGSTLFSQTSKHAVQVEEATFLAEAGIDKAIASLNKLGDSYAGDAEISLGNGTFSVTITNKDVTNKIIEATGYIPSRVDPKVKKTIRIVAAKGVGASFAYGIHMGDGGMQMGNSAIIKGSIYSNGNVVIGNSANVEGDIWVAGGVAPNADQQFPECSGANCHDFSFGKSVSGNTQYDIAQSFVPSASGLITKIALKLKKIGNPPNIPVRLLADNNNKPSKTILASGTLNSNLVTSNYGFIDVAFTTSPSLTAGSRYWIILDTCGNSTNGCNSSPDYWVWSGDLALGYNNGSAMYSPNWQAGNPTWNNPLQNVDLEFKTFMGGVATSITFGNSSTVIGNVHANTIANGTNVTIKGDAYYQILGTGVTVNGIKYPGSSDPPTQVFPISEANIAEWRAQAENAGVTNGDVVGCNMSIGPGKVIGNLVIDNTCTVTVKSPLWVTGNITTLNATQFKLDSSYGNSSGVLMVDGTVILGNSSNFVGSGSSGSYLMLLSTYDSRTSGISAITAGNTALSGILYAPNGIIDLPNGGTFKELTSWKLKTGNNAVLQYETGLSNVSFSSGPTGAYSIVKGTYQIK